MSAQNDAPCGTEKCPPGMVCKSPFCRAEQPAQGEAVAWRAGACFFNFEADAHEFVKNTLSSYPVEPLYTAPPAPSAPDALRESYGCNPSYIADVTGLAPAKEVNHE